MAIGTTAAILGASAIGAVAQSSAANKAAKAQERASDKQIEFATETRDKILNRLNPWYQAGQTSQDALMYEMGMGQKPGGYAGFNETPYQQYVRKTANDAVENSAAARGGLFSTAAMKDLQKNNQALSGQFYDNYLNRLSGLSGSGQNAASGGATAMQNANTSVGNALANIGNAQAAGAIATGNAISGGIQNALTGWQYQQLLAT